MPLELYCPQCGGNVDVSEFHTEQAICPSCGEREALKAYINYKRIHQLVQETDSNMHTTDSNEA